MSFVEEIVREIKAGKKYGVLSEDTIRDVVNLEVKKYKSLKNAKKSAQINKKITPY